MHWAPARSEQLWPRQQESGHSWSREGEEGPGEGAALRPPGRGRAGTSLVPLGLVLRTPPAGAAIALLALFYKAVPAAPVAPGARSPARWRDKRPLPFGKKARSWRLQALNTRGNGAYGRGRASGVRRPPSCQPLRVSSPLPTSTLALATRPVDAQTPLARRTASSRQNL